MALEHPTLRGLPYFLGDAPMVQMKPMLGSSASFEDIERHLKEAGYLLASTKLDGIRALVRGGVVLSRSLKPIRNAHVQARLGRREFEGYDGELIVGPANASDVYRVTNSGVMSGDGEPDFRYFVFDRHDLVLPFRERHTMLKDRTRLVQVVEQHVIEAIDDVERLEEWALGEGYEGLIVRRPDRPYKHGRSSTREGGLLKLKRFADAEAECIGVVELQRNGNEAFTNELGRTARSTAKAGKVGGGVMGALVCRTPEGIEFTVGTGFDAEDRAALWRDRKKVVGRLVKFKSLLIGVKDAPRHPVFLGFRDRSDT
jgi:DNA ligase-1